MLSVRSHYEFSASLQPSATVLGATGRIRAGLRPPRCMIHNGVVASTSTVAAQPRLTTFLGDLLIPEHWIAASVFLVKELSHVSLPLGMSRLFSILAVPVHCVLHPNSSWSRYLLTTALQHHSEVNVFQTPHDYDAATINSNFHEGSGSSPLTTVNMMFSGRTMTRSWHWQHRS